MHLIACCPLLLQGNVADAKRALALAKLSALAAGGEPPAGDIPSASKAAVAEIDARLSLLSLQVGGAAKPVLALQHVLA